MTSGDWGNVIGTLILLVMYGASIGFMCYALTVAF